jgi:hypothetical protein
MAAVTQQMADELRQRMTDLNVRGTYCGAGILVFSVIDFIQHARPDTQTPADAACLFRWIRKRHGEDFRGHVGMESLPRDGSKAYQTPVMNIRQLQLLLDLLGDNVQPEFRRTFEEIYPYPPN